MVVKRANKPEHPPELTQKLQEMKAREDGYGAQTARTRRGKLEIEVYERNKERMVEEIELLEAEEELVSLRKILDSEREERRIIWRKIDVARQEQRRVESRMSEMDVLEADLLTKVQTAYDDGFNLEEQIRHLKEEHMTLDSQITVQRKARTLLQQQTAVAMKESKNINSTIARVKQEVLKLSKESNLLEKEVLHSRRTLAQDERKKDNLLFQVEERKQERADLRNAVQQGRFHVRAVMNQVTLLEQEHLRIQENSQAAHTELSSVQKKLGKLERQRPFLKHNAYNMAQRTAHLQDQYDKSSYGDDELERHMAIVEDRAAEQSQSKRARKMGGSSYGSYGREAYYATEEDSVDGTVDDPDELLSINTGAAKGPLRSGAAFVGQASPCFGTGSSQSAWSPLKDSVASKASPASEEANYLCLSDADSIDDLRGLEGDVEGLSRKRTQWLQKVTSRWLTSPDGRASNFGAPAAAPAGGDELEAAAHSDGELYSASTVSTPRAGSRRSVKGASTASVASGISAASTAATLRSSYSSSGGLGGLSAAAQQRQAVAKSGVQVKSVDGCNGNGGGKALSRSASASTIASTCVPPSSASSARGVPTGLRRNSAASVSSIGSQDSRALSTRRGSLTSASSGRGNSAVAAPPRTGWVR